MAFTVLNSAVRLRVGDTQSLPAQGKLVFANYFDVLGVRPVLGRAFRLEKESAAQPVVVVSYRFWQIVLGRVSAAVGRSVNINGQAFTVIGVAPASFAGETMQADPAELWFPLSMSPVGR